MNDINIVYVNYHAANDILQAVDSLQRDLADCPFSAQVTVVDNSKNQDGIRERLDEKYPHVRYIDAGHNVGFGEANTLGFCSMPSRYYFALNRDTIIPEGSRTIERIIRFMDEHRNIGCMGPKLVNMDRSLQYACYRFDLSSMLIKPLKQLRLDEKYRWIKRRTDRLLMKDFDHQKTQPVDWVLGAAMVVRAEVVRDIGWFDKRYFMYMEDCDWCRSMWDHGWPVYYVHDVVIQHRHARESAKVPGVFRALLKNKLARIHVKSWLKYLWKWRGTYEYYDQVS